MIPLQDVDFLQSVNKDAHKLSTQTSERVRKENLLHREYRNSPSQNVDLHTARAKNIVVAISMCGWVLVV